MSKKTWILISCLVLSLAMGLGGSLAYLTDRDADANVFTMGNVDIELTEDFEQGSELMPGIDVVKDVKVENTGSSTAWVWVEIAIPTAMDTPEDAAKNIIHFNYDKNSVGEGLWNWWDEEGNWRCEEGVMLNDGTDNEYNVYTVLYETALEPGEITEWSAMTKVYLDRFVDIDPNGDVYRVENGNVEGPYWNINENGKPAMHVAAYGIQKDGINSVQEAYDLYYQQWGENGKPEFVNPNEVAIPVKVNSVQDIEEAIADDNLSVTLGGNIENVAQNFYLDYIDGNGYELKVDPYENNSDCTITMEAGTIKDIYILGAPRAIGTGSSGSYALQGDLILQDVYVDGGTYAINVGDGAGHKVIVKDSELYGWISVDGAGLEITNGQIGKRSAAYQHLAVYDNVTLDNVRLFELKMFGRSSTTEDAVININVCSYVTLDEEGNEIGEVLITPENIFDVGLFDWTDSDTEYLRKCKLVVNTEEVAWPEVE